MKRKYLYGALAALLVAGGLWFTRSSRHADRSVSQKSSTDIQLETPHGEPIPGERRMRHAPPDPTRVYREFTPEQRVEFARKGHGPGG